MPVSVCLIQWKWDSYIFIAYEYFIGLRRRTFGKKVYYINPWFKFSLKEF